MSVIRSAVTGGRKRPPAAKGNMGPYSRWVIAMFFRLSLPLLYIPALIWTFYAYFRYGYPDANVRLFQTSLAFLPLAVVLLLLDSLVLGENPSHVRESASQLHRMDVRIAYGIGHLLAHLYPYEDDFVRVFVWIFFAATSTIELAIHKLFGRVEDSSAIAFEVARQSMMVTVLLIRGYNYDDFPTRDIFLVFIPAIPAIPAIVALLTPEDALYKELLPVGEHIPVPEDN